MGKISYKDCEECFLKTYTHLKNVDVGTDLSQIEDLNCYKGIFIGGGNTFKLLKEIKDSNFDKKLKKYLDDGGFIYGGSAGATIFGKTIETAINADKNDVNLKDLSGLNLLNDYNIWCHYDEKNADLSNIKGKTILLYEESGLIFDGKNFIKIGKEYLEI